MEDWTKKSDHEVFTGAGEQPGSQAAYWRDTEIRRRHYLLDKKVAEEQIAASQAQTRAAEATVETAKWTKFSGIAVAATVIITGLSVMLQAMAFKLP